MKTKTRPPIFKNNAQYSLFGQAAAAIGGGGLLASWYLSSFIPVIIVGVALFCVLSFFNGLGA